MSLAEYFETRDPDKLKAVYEKHNNTIRAYIAANVERDDVDDCQQEVYLELMNHNGPLPTNDEAFLLHHTKWVVGKFIRARKFDGRREIEGNELVIGGEEYARDRPKYGADPLDILIAQEEQEIVDRMVQAVLPTLSSPDTFLRHFYDNESFADISKHENIHFVSASDRIERSVKKCRKHLQVKESSYYAATAS